VTSSGEEASVLSSRGLSLTPTLPSPLTLLPVAVAIGVANGAVQRCVCCVCAPGSTELQLRSWRLADCSFKAASSLECVSDTVVAGADAAGAGAGRADPRLRPMDGRPDQPPRDLDAVRKDSLLL
jgi:hypothetical protein